MKTELYWKYHKELFDIWRRIADDVLAGNLTIRDMQSLIQTLKDYTSGFVRSAKEEKKEAKA
ncbi:MAG: hypothetical protein ACP5IV_08070 [Caldisericia bacterium]